ncbi:TonB-dependent receptor [Acinetobacter qingfengensis]|uniref:TonB-dependent receptor n=1 Tax=Acinetobacter qingfengensis TaxID=1262585 RepID=A0A1E7RFQ6_9GAMM|nr:TonB-dependent receptor [Acinetobacter qingfengensis]KAA8732785.1 TonB-dependent receptor [Acinetobacter qingfengensis]OEY98102.1 TonB-dependent receptor [Acinetobacter qingfengensis]
MFFTNHKKNFKKLILGISVLQTMAVYADQQTIQQLPELEVQAIRTSDHLATTPASIYKVQQSEHQNNTNVNFSEVLQGVAGLQINNRENYAQDLQISMRGFGARSTFGVRGIRLYIDGIPATMPDGQGQSSNIDLNSLNDVEVLTGPFSSLYGNSSGGTILATTRQGQGKDSVTLGYLAGSHGKQQANVVLQGGADKITEPAYVISSSYFDTDGYREHSGANKALTNAKLSWNLDDGSKVNWVINHVNINAADPGGLSKADWQANPKQLNSYLKRMGFNSRKEIEQTQTGVTWTKSLNEHNELYAMAYLGNRQVTQYQTIPAATQLNNPKHAGAVIDFDRNYYGLDLRWTGKELLPNTTLVAGVALDQLDEDRRGYENFVTSNGVITYGVKGDLRRNEDNTQWNIDPYVQASWQFLPHWHLDTGLRYSNVHFKSKDQYITTTNPDDSGATDYQKVLPSVALGWNILPKLYGYMSYGKGFETPTFTEMSYKPSLTESGLNLDLKPSSSDNYEIGLKLDHQYGLFTLAAFRTETKNDIVSAGSYGGRATFRNADQTLRQGAEVSWQNKFWKDLSAQASYSYIDATFDADIPATGSVSAISKGSFIPGIAKNQAFARLAWQPEQGFQAGLDVRYMDKMYVNDRNSEYVDSYTVTGINVGYVWAYQDWKINSYARVDNLFDRNYVGSVIVNDSNSRYYEAADGRNFSAGLSITKAF